jgi:hypothetical protein
MREAGESSTGKLGMCTLGRPCARPTGGTHGRTTGTPILLISIRFPLRKQRGAGHPEGCPGPISYSYQPSPEPSQYSALDNTH